MKKIIAAAILAALVGTAAPALAVPESSTACDRECVERVKAKKRAELRRKHRAERRAEMRRYRANPMPTCTWEPESSWDPRTGESFLGRPWARGRYRVVNPSSGAGGKFQFLESTWDNIGGESYADRAELAEPVYQERMARRLMAKQGTSPWVRC